MIFSPIFCIEIGVVAQSIKVVKPIAQESLRFLRELPTDSNKNALHIFLTLFSLVLNSAYKILYNKIKAKSAEWRNNLFSMGGQNKDLEIFQCAFQNLKSRD